MFEVANKGIKKRVGLFTLSLLDCGLDKIMDIIHPLFKDDSNYS